MALERLHTGVELEARAAGMPDWRFEPEFDGLEPKEHWQLSDGEHSIDVLNYCDEVAVSEAQLELITFALADYQYHFPEAVTKINAITVSDRLPKSSYGNEAKFPKLADSFIDQGMIALTPHAINAAEYHNGQLKISEPLVATIAHELTHFVTDEFEEDWKSRAGTKWEYLQDENGVRELVPVVGGERCVTDYARKSPEEDICESVVAFMYDPESLRKTSNVKFKIVQKVFERHIDKLRPWSIVETAED